MLGTVYDKYEYLGDAVLNQKGKGTAGSDRIRTFSGVVANQGVS